MKTLRSAKFRLAAVAAILALATPPPARAEVLLNQSIDSTYIADNPCVGEPIALSGSAHVLATLTVDQSGGQHYHVHVNYQDVRAIGLITGTTYVATGAENGAINVTSGAANATVAGQARFIAPGGHNDFYVHLTLHMTINANGDVTVFFDDLRFGCN